MSSDDQLVTGFLGLIFIFVLLPSAVTFLALVLFSAIMELRFRLEVQTIARERRPKRRSWPPAKFWAAFAIPAVPIAAIHALIIFDRLSQLLSRALAVSVMNRSVSDVLVVLTNAFLFLGTSLVLPVAGMASLFVPIFALLRLGEGARQMATRSRRQEVADESPDGNSERRPRTNRLAVIAPAAVVMTSSVGLACLVGTFFLLLSGKNPPALPPVSFVSKPPSSQDSVREDWAIHYAGTDNVEDVRPVDIAVDRTGSIYVTGLRGTSRRSDRNTVITKFSSYVAIKYSSDGRQLWVARYGGEGDEDEDQPIAVAVDGTGNLYVTGGSKGQGTGFDYATVKFSSDGRVLWVARYDSGGGGNDWPSDIAVDGQGDVYVAGSTAINSANAAIAIVKYDPEGRPIWVSRHQGSGTRDHCRAAGLALDKNSDPHVVGFCPSERGGTHDAAYVTMKYGSDGAQQWVAYYGGPDDKQVGGLALDDVGNVYVTGRSSDECATVKYGADGKQLWTARHKGWSQWIVCQAVAVDAAGYVYVGGMTNGGKITGTAADYTVIKYAPDGRETWVARYDGPSHSNDEPVGMAVDGAGNVYIAGTSNGGHEAGPDYTVVKYGANGDLVWVARYNGPEPSVDNARALALDEAANVYVTGSSASDNAITVKYSQSDN